MQYAQILLYSPPAIAGPASTNLRTGSLCYRHHSDKEGGRSEAEEEDETERDDPTVPLLKQNVYAWYLAVSSNSNYALYSCTGIIIQCIVT